MKNLVFGIFALVLFAFNGNAQTIEDLRNSKNPFNDKGERYYNYLVEISSLIKERKITKDELLNKINKDVAEFKTDIKEDYMEQNRLYFEKISTSLEEIINLENDVVNNDNISDKNPLLERISIIKWTVFFINKLTVNTENARGFSSWESCVDRCMRAELNAVFGPGSNWIKKSLFILSCAEATMAMYASCAWDCW